MENKKIQPYQGNITAMTLQHSGNYRGSLNQELLNTPRQPEYKPMSVPDLKNQNVKEYPTPAPYSPPAPIITNAKAMITARRWYEFTRKKRKERMMAAKVTPPPPPAHKPENPRRQLMSSHGSVVRTFQLFSGDYKPEASFTTSDTRNLRVVNRANVHPVDWDRGDW